MASSELVSSYLERRESLIKRERSLRLDSISADAPNELETRAAQQVDRLRLASQALDVDRPLEAGQNANFFSVYASRRAGHLRMDPLYATLTRVCRPSESWFCASAKQTALDQQMPKGANLHCHLDGSCDAHVILSMAVSTPDMCLRSDRPLLEFDDLFTAAIDFRVILREARQTSDLFRPSYTAMGWVSVESVRDRFPFKSCYDGMDELDVFNASLLPKSSPSASAFDAWLHRYASTTHDRTSAKLTVRMLAVSR